MTSNFYAVQHIQKPPACLRELHPNGAGYKLESETIRECLLLYAEESGSFLCVCSCREFHSLNFSGRFCSGPMVFPLINKKHRLMPYKSTKLLILNMWWNKHWLIDYIDWLKEVCLERRRSLFDFQENSETDPIFRHHFIQCHLR